ncbi:hypothetical protein EON78_06350, partial [bacterium]
SYVELLKNLDVATAELPTGACKNIDEIMPFIQSTGGLIISDKGYADTSYMEGEHECFFSVHGNSFAHSLNFPFLEIYANKKGYFSNRTSELLNSLQVLLVTKQLNNQVNNEFINQFIDNNFNEDTHDYMDTGYKEKYEKNFSKSIRYYKRVIKHRIYDSRVYFDLGSAYIGHGDQNKALEYLMNHPEDYLDEHDFDFEIGMAYDYLNDYPTALKHYMISSQKFPNQKETFFNIANVHHKMKNYLEAYMYYQKAIILKQDYDIALTGLKNLKDDMFNDWLDKNGIFLDATNFDQTFINAEKAFNNALSVEYNEDDLRSILDTFLDLADKMPNKLEVYSKISTIFYVLGDLENCQKYIELVRSPDTQEAVRETAWPENAT